MAKISPYISEGLQVGQPAELKIHTFRWRTVGSGKIMALSDYELELDGRVELNVYKGDLKIHLALLDQDAAATTGPCKIEANALVDEAATYSTDGEDLTITANLDGQDVKVVVSRSGNKNMTECKVSSPIHLTAYVGPGAS